MADQVTKRQSILQEYDSVILRQRKILDSLPQQSQLLDSLPQQSQLLNSLPQGQGIAEQGGLPDELTALGNQLSALAEAYLDTLPELSISRCPFTGQLVRYTVDDIGLDGLWWNYAEPVRKALLIPDLVPDTILAADGAMKINNPGKAASFTVIPGPDKPFVIPALLKRPEVKVVVSATTIAGNPTWWIVYFAFPMPNGIEAVNDYGSDRYSFVNRAGHRLYFSASYPESAYDYDLEKWIRQGKLLWIEPGDESMKLHAAATKCPYLAIEGNGHVQVIRAGQVSLLRELKTDLPEASEELKQKAQAALHQVNSRGES